MADDRSPNAPDMVEERKGGRERRRMMAKPRPERQHGCRDVFSLAQFAKSMPAALDRHEESEHNLQCLRELCDEMQGEEGPARRLSRRDIVRKLLSTRGRQFACSMPEREDSERQFLQFLQFLHEEPRERRPKNKATEQALTEEENVCDDIDKPQSQTQAGQYACSMPTALEHEDIEGRLRSRQEAYANLREWRPKDTAEKQAPTVSESAKDIECDETRSFDLDAPPYPPKKNNVDGARRSYQGVDEFEDQASRSRRSSGWGSLLSHQKGKIDDDDEHEVGEARGSMGSGSFRVDMRHFGCSTPYRPKHDDDEEDELAALCRQYAEMQRQEEDDDEVDFIPCRGLTANSVLRVSEHNPYDMSEMTLRRSSGWGSLPSHQEDEIQEDDEYEDGEARESTGSGSFQVDMRHFRCGQPYRPQRGDDDEDEPTVLCRQFAEVQRREKEDEEVDFVPCHDLTANSVLPVLKCGLDDMSEMTLDVPQSRSRSRGAF